MVLAFLPHPRAALLLGCAAGRALCRLRATGRRLAFSLQPPASHRMSDLYFAYGSNLNDADFHAWCQLRGFESDCMRALGTAMLPDTELVFDHYSRARYGGVLNLRPRLGQVTAGVVFEVMPEGWDVLDIREGAMRTPSRSGRPTHRRSRRHAILADGSVREVFTYEAEQSSTDSFVVPSQDYVEIVRRGLEAYDLDTATLDQAALGQAPDFAVTGLFLCGAEMRGESRFADLARHGVSCVLLAHAEGVLLDLVDATALCLGPEPIRVRGEFLVPVDLPALLAAKDTHEGALPMGAPGGWCRRTVLPVNVGDGHVQPAWAYVVERASLRAAARISSGCWRTYRGGAENFYRALVTAHESRNPQLVAMLQDALHELLRPATAPTLTATPHGIAAALAEGSVSERSLARISGAWAVVP